MIEIKHRITGEVIFTVDADTLVGADLVGTNLAYVSLGGADIRWADLYRANLTGANLAGANMTRTGLYGANLGEANLVGTDLTGAYLNGANLAGAKLTGADLTGVRLWNTKGNGKQIKNIVLPEDDTYQIAYTRHAIQIGCQNNTAEEWVAMPDSELLKMGGRKAVDWYRKHMQTVLDIVASDPAEE